MEEWQTDQKEVYERIKAEPENWVDFGGVWRTQAFVDTMIHHVPDAQLANREAFILASCKGRRVLHLGCRGQSEEPNGLHNKIMDLAEVAYGTDIEECDYPNFLKADLESNDWVESFMTEGVNLVLASEILEHLPNAGRFLENVHKFQCEAIITTPNAYCHTRFSLMRKGLEFDNVQHLALYSYNSLTRLLERYGFMIKRFLWADSVMPFFSKGLIFVVEPA